MLSIFDKLVDLLKYSIQAQKLIGIILSNIAHTDQIYPYLEKLFTILKNSEEKVEQIQILEIINCLLYEPSKPTFESSGNSNLSSILIKKNMDLI